MSETPEKKKARLRYDNVFKTAWTDEFHFIKHTRKVNKFAFCEFCRTATGACYDPHVTSPCGTATECIILRPSERQFSGGGVRGKP